VREAIEPPSSAIARPGGEHQRQVARTAGLAKALLKRNEKLVGKGNPDESPDRQRVIIDDRRGSRLGGDDISARPRRRGAMLPAPRRALV
jgi:hypothetical protein